MAVVISDQLLDRRDRLLEAEPDEHLVALAQSGHDAAFAAIVRRYEPELLAQARRLSSDGRGEDAVQQAFLNAFAALQAGSEVRHLRGWLHQILRRAVIRARVPADAPLEAASAYGESLEETVQRRAQAHATLAELSALPERQRDALLGTAIMGFPRAQVAQRMGLSEGAVRQLVHRARLRLRQAATALVPLPVGRFFGGSGATGSEAVLGAGAAASGGAGIKVGALIASGVVATGLAVTHSLSGQHHRGGAASVTRHRTTPAPRVRQLMEAPAVRAGATSGGPATGVVVHAQAPAPRGGSRLTASGGLYGSGESHQGHAPGRGRDGGGARSSGLQDAQGSGTAGRRGDGGARGSGGGDGRDGSAGADHGGRSGSGSTARARAGDQPRGRRARVPPWGTAARAEAIPRRDATGAARGTAARSAPRAPASRRSAQRAATWHRPVAQMARRVGPAVRAPARRRRPAAPTVRAAARAV